MVSKFRIASVDMNGFNGREHHPQPSDIGLVVTAIGMKLFHIDVDELEVTPEIAAEHPYALQDDGLLFQSWTCVTDDGRLLEMMDFELQPMR